MSTDQVSVALAGVLDALTLVQKQLDALTESSQRIEATHREIVNRLDTIDAGQAAVTDLTPILEMILGRSIDDREIMKTQLGTIAAAIGFAHAAANGNRGTAACRSCQRSAPRALYPDSTRGSVIGRAVFDGLAQRRIGRQHSRAYRSSEPAVSALTNGYPGDPGPALPPGGTHASRDQGEGCRGAGTTKHRRCGRSDSLGLHDPVHELAELWRAGKAQALYGEPELAGAIDIFDDAERRLGLAAGEQFSHPSWSRFTAI